jgi:serine/threonine protein kinase
MATHGYLSSEFYFTRVQDSKTDMWAAGIVFYWLLLKRFPKWRIDDDDENDFFGQVKDHAYNFGKPHLEGLKETKLY